MTDPIDGGALRWRRLAADDLPLLARWLADPVVARWWNHDSSPEGVERDFGASVRGEEPGEDLVVSLDGQPVGLVQRAVIGDYPEDLTEFAGLVEVPEGAVELDYLVGEPGLRGRGLGPRIIAAVVEDTWTAHPAAPAVLVAVAATNVASWRALEKAGLRRVGEGPMTPESPADGVLHYVYRVDRPRQPPGRMRTPPPPLPRAAVDAAVAAERRRLADHVADLTDEQWATPSLCPAWTVRDVVAHLTLTTRTSVPRLLRAAVRARGSFDRMAVDLAAEQAAAHTTAELVALLRESARSTRRVPASTPMDPLMDLVVHGQDIARPLRRRYVSPPEVVAACLAYVAVNRFMGGPRRLAGVRLVSTDTGWTLGEGAELRGPDVDLLLVAAGRRAGLDALEGPGSAVVAERLG